MRLVFLFAGAAAGWLLVRRRARRRRDRVDLYYADGSMVSLDDRSLEAQRLLPYGRDILHAVRD